jgi:hypothetical protein
VGVFTRVKIFTFGEEGAWCTCAHTELGDAVTVVWWNTSPYYCDSEDNEYLAIATVLDPPRWKLVVFEGMEWTEVEKKRTLQRLQQQFEQYRLGA